MKRKLSLVLVVSVLILGVHMLMAQQPVVNTETWYWAPQHFVSPVWMNQSQWYINGTQVTANAANLNSGVASSTAALVSNAVLKVYGSNLVIVAGGAISAPGGAFGATLVNADISTAAAIAQSKLATNTLGVVVVTNACNGATNVFTFTAQGILSNWTHTP